MIIWPGDIFCSSSPTLLGGVTNAVQSFWSVDKRSQYSHSGILIDREGTTIEALLTIRSRNFFDSYKGKQVLIGRHSQMTLGRLWNGLVAISGDKGNIYPFHRLLFFMFPPLARYVNFGDWTVCSELTAKFLCGAGLMDFWSGVNPDFVSEMIHNWKNWKVVWEGKL
jgi:hypothetical protein